ncbi:hypothetical protein BSN85_16325 [Bradyrhizobium brasilense]|nr:hypothetical protein BSN85_16325 [Bradyrhizobium brasilense]
MVASIASFRNEDVVGTIVDVQSFEVAAAYNDPVAAPLTLRDDVAKCMFRFTSGADLVRPFLQSWRDVRQALAEREPRNGEIVAISRSKFTNNGSEKIVDLLKGMRMIDERSILKTPRMVRRETCFTAWIATGSISCSSSGTFFSSAQVRIVGQIASTVSAKSVAEGCQTTDALLPAAFGSQNGDASNVIKPVPKSVPRKWLCPRKPRGNKPKSIELTLKNP